MSDSKVTENAELTETEIRLRTLESKVDTLLDCFIKSEDKTKKLQKAYNELVCCLRYTAEG